VIDPDNNWTSIPSSGISFCLPTSFGYEDFHSQEGKIAYKVKDESLVLIDCSHLCNSSNVF
jgi:hypothetical protein